MDAQADLVVAIGGGSPVGVAKAIALELGLPILRCRPLPFFADRPLTKIDVWAVDAYRLHKLEESDDRRRRLAEGRPRTDALGRPLRPLSAGSINKTIEVLRWLLSFAVEYGWIDDNPAAGTRRRIKVARTPPPHLGSAGQIAAVLDAAAELDADPGWLIDDRLPGGRHAGLLRPARP